ncbi:hypothetical protein R3I93_002515 [Phoxinus phoxinus]|uniref:Myb/SANT-like DNA-binding domain-containing protein n=1 Tax=Phoxinus phoxinus TaxID=58324 RepID=A0AAN9DM57_9TELE
MSRGLTWSVEETSCLINIWAEAHVAQLLERTHKNTDVFNMFTERMKERGYERSPAQCRVKVKKLRQHEVRDALNKSGNSGEEKEKCQWYDELDKILGTRPTVCPVDIVESYSPTDKTSSSLMTQPSSSSYSGETKLDVNGEKGITPNDPESNGPTDSPLATSTDIEDSDATPSCDEQCGESSGRLAIPGAQARKHLGRKRKAKDCLDDSGLQAYMAQQSKQLHEMFEAEQKQQAQENAVLENLLRAHQEAEERRFQAMQAQQEANRQMFTQLVATLANALSSGQSQHPPSQHPPSQHPTHLMPPPTHFIPPPSQLIPPAPMNSTPTSAWSIPHPPRAQPQQPMALQLMRPSMIRPGEEAQNVSSVESHGNLPISAVLHQLNDSEHFYNL